MSYASSWPSFNESPLKVSIKFFMPMAKSWKEAKKDAYRFAPHAVPPDLDKLIRSTLDAMTGVCFRDDAVVASVFATKAWVPPGEAGARIIVSVF
jgi:Holliday junction resolvase RusA-like endonuclease